MMGSLQVFGQLYPRDGQFGEKDKNGNKSRQPWYWYNNIIHSLGRHDTIPDHAKIPEDKTEMQMIQKVLAGFRHPLMADMKRRFEKYMTKGFDGNKDGGEGQLKMRERREDKLEWMLDASL